MSDIFYKFTTLNWNKSKANIYGETSFNGRVTFLPFMLKYNFGLSAPTGNARSLIDKIIFVYNNILSF